MNTYTNQVREGFRLIYVVACLSIAGLPFDATAKSRPARPTLPEGESLIFRANDQQTNFVAEAVSGTAYLKSAQFVEGWSGTALLMAGETPSHCMIPVQGTRKRPNFSPNTGSIRLWFSTAWSSTSLGGQGSGTHARLLEIAHVNTKTPTGFALYFDPDGNTVYLSAYQAGRVVDIVHATVALEKDVFHQLGLVYGPEATLLVLDGKIIATGLGLPALAQPTDLDNWMCFLGSNPGGLEKIEGQLDEIYFFPYACTEAQFGWDYQSQSLLAAMGPISVQESIAQYRTLRRHHGPQRAEGGPSPPDPGPGGGGGSTTNDMPFYSSWEFPYDTNVLHFSKIVYDTNGIALTIVGGETNGVYDLYGTSTLGPSNAASATWTWLLRTAPGETNLTLADAGLAYEFFIVGRTNATNGHVLSYAFEQLVSHGNSDANSNGVSDAWEFTWFNGLLNASTLNADPDRDGVSNLMEYQAGANPFDPASVSNLLTASWRFDSTNWVGEQGQLPTYASGVTLTNGASTNALRIAAGLSNGVAYADLKPAEGTANLNCQQGTVRCWFQPQWSGTLSNMVLLQTGDGSNDWKLGITGNGTNLCFSTSQNGTNQTNVSAAIAWSNSIWHQLVLTYNRTSSQIYVDAQLVATNMGVTYIPTITQRAAGLTIGNDRTGQCPLPGLLDELELYNYPLDQTTIAADYVSFLFRNPAFDSNNNGIPDWWEWQTYGHLLTNPVATNSGLAIRITYPNANSFAP